MNWKAIIDRWTSITSEEHSTNNKLDDKKNNFVLEGTKTHRFWIFGFKVINRNDIITQKFVDDNNKKNSIGFDKE
jgi:hypothetical protein